jgi:SsrA-binding protein
VSAGTPGDRTVASNRRARHDYQILESLEAGIRLSGSEVKSLRAGRASLTEAYGQIRDGEAWLEGMHIPPYEQGVTRGYDPIRPRKLLLHRREIDRLFGKVKQQGLAMVPMRVYFTHGIAKLELGLGKGKREYEKRQSIARRDSEREMEQAAHRRR